MTQAITHAEAHADWSAAQLATFRNMSPQARLDAVKSGALEHWTPADRDSALDLIADAPRKEQHAVPAKRLRFEPAQTPLPSLRTHPPRIDPMTAAAATGWLLITFALAGHAYGFY